MFVSYSILSDIRITNVPRIQHLYAKISRIFPGLVDNNRVPLNPPEYAGDDAQSLYVV